jgi:hypothetical protein
MDHYRLVNTYVARTLAEFAGLRHAGGESSWKDSPTASWFVQKVALRRT